MTTTKIAHTPGPWKVGETDWEIVRRFHVAAADLAGRWAVLELEFVDTFAEIVLNGTTIATLGSCFLRHRIDVTGALVAGSLALTCPARSNRLPGPRLFVRAALHCPGWHR